MDKETALGERIWMYFIGKWGDQIEGHPLFYHMIDSAAVAELMWHQVFTAGAQRQFCDWLHLSEADCGRLLSFWTALHDLGKATPSFQRKHSPSYEKLKGLGFDFPKLAEADIRHHSLLSQWLLVDFSRELGIQPVRIFNQFRFAIGGHHGSFHTQEDGECTLARNDNLGGPGWLSARHEMVAALVSLYNPPTLPVLELNQAERNSFFNLLTGFFVACDWIASQDELFPYHPVIEPAPDYLTLSRKQAHEAMCRTGWIGWKPDDAQPGFSTVFEFAPNSLQQIVLEQAASLSDPFLIVIEAPTGSGKTEAALSVAERAIQRNKLCGLYIAMPTQATSNQMFGRVGRFLSTRYQDQPLTNFQLLHGNSLSNEDFQKIRLTAVEDQEHERDSTVSAMEWFLPRKRALLAPFGVGTVDQTFMSVLRAKHSFLRLYGLHRKVVIFDEVHAYDTYMKEIFCQLLAWLRAIGTSVIILSATLPERTRLEMLRAFQPAVKDLPPAVKYPRMSINDGQSLRIISLGEFPDREVQIVPVDHAPETWIEQLRGALSEGGCAAIVCNTVDRAQMVYSLVREARIVAEEDLFLLHARMPFCWRKQREDEILRRFGKLEAPASSPRRGIVVATQIIEQSLDLDFDLLVSDLAPVDLLIQRIGRLQRHSSQKFPPLRPERVSKAVCLVCQPDSPERDEAPHFGVDEWVYDSATLQRTYFVLREREALRLPSQSDELINLVYSNEALPICSPAQNQFLEDAYRQMRREQDGSAENAKNRLIGDVDRQSTLGEKAVYLREDDADVGKDFRALTRETDEPSVQLVCFTRVKDKTVLVDGGYPLEIPKAPSGEAINHALKSMVSIQKRGVVEGFQKQSHPEAWKKLPALRRAYPAIFENRICELDQEFRLILDEHLGLVIEKRKGI